MHDEDIAPASSLADNAGDDDTTNNSGGLILPQIDPNLSKAIFEERAKDILDVLGFRVPELEGHAHVSDESEAAAELSETILASNRAWDGDFLHVDVVDVELPNGHHSTRDIVRHPGAVAIIALDADNRVLLVEQYRTALERLTLEIPAGKLDSQEDVTACARRELEEETGYTASEMRYLIPVAVAAGYSDEIIHLFLATGLVGGPAHPDSDEFVSSRWMDLRELVDLVLDGRIEDSKTIIAALICDAIAQRL